MSKNQHQNISAAMPTTQKPTAESSIKPRWVAIASLITLSIVTAIKPAHASGVTYNFTVQVTSNAYEAQGLLNGMTEQGSFTYDSDGLTAYNADGLAATRDEYASPSKGNLSLTFNFLNTIYTEKNDLNYGSSSYVPDNPAALFSNGELLGLDFLVVPSQLQPPQNALGFRIYKNVFYAGSIDNSPGGSGPQVGTVTYINTTGLPEPPPPSAGVAAVPEPSEVGGAIVALGFLSVWARKMKGKG